MDKIQLNVDQTIENVNLFETLQKVLKQYNVAGSELFGPGIPFSFLNELRAVGLEAYTRAIQNHVEVCIRSMVKMKQLNQKDRTDDLLEDLEKPVEKKVAAPTLTSCQEYGLKLLSSDSNVFISGEAGTGKTFLLSRYKEEFNPTVLASTGMAAVLAGGITFNSYFALGTLEGTDGEIIGKACNNHGLRERILKETEIIIDEVSMLHGRALNLAEQICRNIRGSKKPWGGIRIIAVGDFLQLPPVCPDTDKIDWAFASDAWKASKFKPVVLLTKVRSKDSELNDVLSDIRLGEVSQRVKKFLNRKSKKVDLERYEGTIIYPRLKQVEKLNALRLEHLETELHTLTMTCTGETRDVEQLVKSCPISRETPVKIGALVMTRVNSPQNNYVNGTTGIVEEINNDIISIRKSDGKLISVTKHTYELKRYDNTVKDYKVVATAKCFPINLAWAISIHKAQGATLEKAAVDLGRLWEYGQAYTALSRLKNAEGLTVLSWDADSIFSSKRSLKFYNRMIERMKNQKSVK